MERKPGLLDYDGPIVRISQGILRLILLNLLFLVTCLPVVTLGAALLARSAVFLERCRDGGWKGHAAQNYFRAFRRCWKQGIILSGVLLPAGGILYLDFGWLGADTGTAPGILLGMLAVVTLLLAMFLEYYAAVLSVNPISMAQGVRTSLELLLANWWRALLAAAGKGGILLLLLSVPAVFLAALPLMLLIGHALAGYLTAALLGPTLRQTE